MEVDASALRENVAAVREAVGPGPGLLPMVKADAYGTGLEEALGVLEPLAPWGYGVATLAEGEAVRRPGIRRPVVVFTPLGPWELQGAARAGLTVTVSHPDVLEALASAGADAPDFHLEVDTGMGRAGFDWREPGAWAPLAARAHRAGARWTGCYTHLHSADEEAGSAREQARRFRTVLEAFAPPGPPFLRHVLNSPGSLRLPELALELVRPGIFLYGGRAGRGLPPPQPVASVRGRVVHLKDARPGDTLGYGATHVARTAERWATVSLGYGDGLPRVLGNRGSALVRGRRVRIVGRISMDVTVVDISAVPSVSLGEIVTFLGSDGEDRITVDEVAEWAGTISYEILTGFTPRLPRIWREDDDRR
jgi:alanine racemase